MIGKLLGVDVDPRTFSSDERIVFGSMVGVEIELEEVRSGFGDFNDCDAGYLWRMDRDSSLRGTDSFEFKFSRPLAGVDIIRALEYLESYLSGLKHAPLTSERTSVHVHINTLDMSPAALAKFLFTYATMERVLYHYCGGHREESIFCQPWYIAQGDFGALAKLYEVATQKPDDRQGNRLRDLRKSFKKYSGANFGALFQFGTVEFRHHAGEWRCAPLLDWINILLCLKRYAVQNPEEVPDIILKTSGRGARSLLVDVFGDYAERLAYIGVEKDIIRGIRVAQDIIFARQNNETSTELRKKKEGTHDLYEAFCKKHGKDVSVTPSSSSGFGPPRFIADTELNDMLNRGAPLVLFNHRTNPETGRIHIYFSGAPEEQEESAAVHGGYTQEFAPPRIRPGASVTFSSTGSPGTWSVPTYGLASMDGAEQQATAPEPPPASEILAEQEARRQQLRDPLLSDDSDDDEVTF